jgi:hypothetical protein
MGTFEKMNIVERANKVLSFRKVIRDLCRKKGLEYPSDDKIAEWINQCYGWEVEDFMKDYTEHEGIFRTPLADFMERVNAITWANKPTEDEIKAFVATNGYDLSKFIKQRTIASYEPLERDTLMATLKLTDDKLVKLWNEFIEESAKYGEDSYIYDLTKESDLRSLRSHMTPNKFVEICRLAKDNNTKYVQWFNLNDGEMSAKTDIKGIIIAYWSDIFERVMLYPYAYQFEVEKYAEGDGSVFFDDVFFPILTERLGWHIDGDKGTITKIEKK